MKDSPLKQAMQSKSYKGVAPKGVPALSMGKGTEMAPNKRGGGAGVRRTEEQRDYKINPRLAKRSGDKSSSQSNPINKGDDNKKRYHPVPQPAQYSNDGPRPTKFVC